MSRENGKLNRCSWIKPDSPQLLFIIQSWPGLPLTILTCPSIAEETTTESFALDITMPFPLS